MSSRADSISLTFFRALARLARSAWEANFAPRPVPRASVFRQVKRRLSGVEKMVLKAVDWLDGGRV